MSLQGSESVAAVRHFNGDAEDSREYKRWKTWVSKLLTLDKLPSELRGAYIYSLVVKHWKLLNIWNHQHTRRRMETRCFGTF